MKAAIFHGPHKPLCGTCDYCLTGKTHLCQTRPARKKEEPPKLSWNGTPVNQFANLSAYAEQMLVHENAIVKIDDTPCRLGLVGLAGLVSQHLRSTQPRPATA